MISTNGELVHSQEKIYGFDKKASTSSELTNLLIFEILVEMGMKDVLGVVGNEDFWVMKIHATLLNSTPSLSMKYYKHLLVVFSCFYEVLVYKVCIRLYKNIGGYFLYTNMENLALKSWLTSCRGDFFILENEILKKFGAFAVLVSNIFFTSLYVYYIVYKFIAEGF